jgi:hypothetical protein
MSRQIRKAESVQFPGGETSLLVSDLSRIRNLSYHLTARTDTLSAWSQTIDQRINDGRDFTFLTHSVLRRIANSMVDEGQELVAVAARLKEVLDDA